MLDGWTSFESKGSMPSRPLAMASLIERSDRITALASSDAV